jgi:hypothetical protein
MTQSFKPNFTITNRITAGLTRIEQARGFLEAATLSESWVRELLNYKRAFEFVSECLEDGGPIIEGLVREITCGLRMKPRD